MSTRDVTTFATAVLVTCGVLVGLGLFYQGGCGSREVVDQPTAELDASTEENSGDNTALDDHHDDNNDNMHCHGNGQCHSNGDNNEHDQPDTGDDPPPDTSEPDESDSSLTQQDASEDALIDAEGNAGGVDSSDTAEADLPDSSVPGQDADDVAQAGDGGDIGRRLTVPLGSPCTEDTECYDDEACTEDTCVGGECQYPTRRCDDNNACTEDSCVETVCSDGICEEGGCIFTNTCESNQECNPEHGCFTPEQPECSRDEECTHEDPCTAGTCLAGECSFEQITCPDDNNPCTSNVCVDGGCPYTSICRENEECNPERGCIPIQQPECNRDEECTHEDPCTAGTCLAGECSFEQITCPDDNNPCTSNVCVDGGCPYTSICRENEECNPERGCIPIQQPRCTQDTDCEDNDACTTDTCVGDGDCAHATVTCDDEDPSTVNRCFPESGCDYETVPCETHVDCQEVLGVEDRCSPPYCHGSHCHVGGGQFPCTPTANQGDTADCPTDCGFGCYGPPGGSGFCIRQ